MYVKKCEFCNKYIKTKIERKRFCNNICQRKHYNSKPEIKKINRIRTREYRRNHPEWRERHRILAITKHRKKRAEYWKDYEIDHIIPLRTFKLTNPNEVKKAFNPSNLQWLTIEENRKKSGKVIQE